MHRKFHGNASQFAQLHGDIAFNGCGGKWKNQYDPHGCGWIQWKRKWKWNLKMPHWKTWHRAVNLVSVEWIVCPIPLTHLYDFLRGYGHSSSTLNDTNWIDVVTDALRYCRCDSISSENTWCENRQHQTNKFIFNSCYIGSKYLHCGLFRHYTLLCTVQMRGYRSYCWNICFRVCAYAMNTVADKIC